MKCILINAVAVLLLPMQAMQHGSTLLQEIELNRLASQHWNAQSGKLLQDRLQARSPIKTFDLLCKLPNELIVKVFNGIGSTELYDIHKKLLEIRFQIPSRIAHEDEVFITRYIDGTGNFKWNNILGCLDIVAERRIARALKCTVEDIFTKDYQPLKDLPDEDIQREFTEAYELPSLTSEEFALLKDFKPFKERLSLNPISGTLHTTATNHPALMDVLPIIELFSEGMLRFPEKRLWKARIADTIRHVNKQPSDFVKQSSFERYISADIQQPSEYLSHTELALMYVKTVPLCLQQIMVKGLTRRNIFDRSTFRGLIVIENMQLHPLRDYNLKNGPLLPELKKHGYSAYLNGRFLSASINPKKYLPFVDESKKIF